MFLLLTSGDRFQTAPSNGMIVNKGTQVQQTAPPTVFNSLPTVVYILYMLLHLWGCGNFFVWWRISFLIVRRHVTFDPEGSVRHNQHGPPCRFMKFQFTCLLLYQFCYQSRGGEKYPNGTNGIIINKSCPSVYPRLEYW